MSKIKNARGRGIGCGLLGETCLSDDDSEELNLIFADHFATQNEEESVRTACLTHEAIQDRQPRSELAGPEFFIVFEQSERLPRRHGLVVSFDQSTHKRRVLFGQRNFSDQSPIFLCQIWRDPSCRNSDFAASCYDGSFFWHRSLLGG